MSIRSKKIFTVLVFIAFFVFSTTASDVFAATPTPTPKVTSSAVNDAEIERERQLTKELALNIPAQTDDPTYPITFTDPSKQGVDITVDEKSYAKAQNPFLLPNLAIGEHKIRFTYKTKEGLGKVLTKTLIIVPKAPLFENTLKTAVVKPATMVINGTALPQSSLMIIINSLKVHTVTVGPDGKWEFIVPEPVEGSNNIVAFTVKNGISSTPSKIVSISYSKTEGDTTNPTAEITEKINPVIGFFQDFIKNMDTNRRESPEMFYGITAIAIMLILILLTVGFKKKAAKRRDEKTIAALFGTLQKDGGTIVDTIKSTFIGKTPETTKKLNVLDDENEPKKKEEKKSKKVLKLKKNVKKSVVETPTEEIKTEVVEETKEVTVENPPAEKKSLLSFFGKKPTPIIKIANEEKSLKDIAEEETVKEVLSASKSAGKTKATAEVESEPQIEEIDEEPEKKVLTKEEFLKEFKKKKS